MIPNTLNFEYLKFQTTLVERIQKNSFRLFFDVFCVKIEKKKKTEKSIVFEDHSALVFLSIVYKNFHMNK